MSGRRIAVTGGRHYANVGHVWRTLDELHAIESISELIDGASDDVTGPYLGADYWAYQWALARDVGSVRLHADWKTYGKAAGPIRNGRIVDERPDLLVEFPGGAGTSNMVRQASEAGIKVFRA